MFVLQCYSLLRIIFPLIYQGFDKKSEFEIIKIKFFVVKQKTVSISAYIDRAPYFA